MNLRLGLILAGFAAAVGASVVHAQVDPFVRAECEQQFAKLRNELEKRGMALQAAGKRKAPAGEMCKLLRSFTATEAQVLKFFDESQAKCGIPDEPVRHAREGHAKAVTMRNQVCQIAAGPPAPPPPAPSAGLSGALGSNALGGPPPPSTGGSGVFDTLSGNALRQ